MALFQENSGWWNIIICPDCSLFHLCVVAQLLLTHFPEILDRPNVPRRFSTQSPGQGGGDVPVVLRSKQKASPSEDGYISPNQAAEAYFTHSYPSFTGVISITRWWFQFFNFHPYLGKWSNLTSIFFKGGWNRQLDGKWNRNTLRFGGDYTPLAHHRTFGGWIHRDL